MEKIKPKPEKIKEEQRIIPQAVEQEIEYEDDIDEELNREVETMIECAQFLKNINKKDKTNKFEYILQEEINIPLLEKKRKRIDISKESESEDLFDTDWRSKY